MVIIRLNPLNQVYVFNGKINEQSYFYSLSYSLNPLNQVYVFNQKVLSVQLPKMNMDCLNPLNQVYVFNAEKGRRKLDARYKNVLIP